MRLIVLSLFCIAALSQVSSAQGTEQSCASDSPYEEIHEHNLASLRWSLFSVSKLKETGYAKAVRDDLLRRLTNGSVAALANTYSLRARLIQECKREPEDYYSDIAANERFIALFSSTTSAESFPAVSYIKVSQQDGRPVEFALDPVIREQLSLWTEHKGWANDDARRVAASELLGRRVRWTEHDLKPIPEIELSPTGAKLAEARPSQVTRTLLELHQPSSDRPEWETNLEILSNHYTQAPSAGVAP
jgi:hypothetical protein